jgi:hypothetical protein
MSIFGSRDDDPLLQGDPFAPSDEDEPHDAASPSDDDPAQKTRDPAGSTDDVPPPGASVFGPSDEDTQVLVHLVEEAADGRLGRLNAALDAGWRLRRVELRDDPPGDPTRSTADARALAFVLRRSGTP